MLTELTVFGTSILSVSKVWVNQPRVQGSADGKLTLLSGIPPGVKQTIIQYLNDAL